VVQSLNHLAHELETISEALHFVEVLLFLDFARFVLLFQGDAALV